MSKRRQPSFGEMQGNELPAKSRVPIFVVRNSEGPIFEGWARIVSPCVALPHWYRVRFENEQVDRIRLVLPASLHDAPFLSAELLRELLRSGGVSPWTEFFSDDDSKGGHNE